MAPAAATTTGAELRLYGVGAHVPPTHKTRDLVAAAGGDLTRFGAWEYVGRAGADDHPSTLGAEALQRALADAGVAARDLTLLISGGMSRDYLPSWSLATELARRVGASGHCLGIDLSLGCLGSLTALEIASGWLRGNGGGLAAIVAAERWTPTVDYASSAARGMWGYADGAGACIVGMGVSGDGAAVYRGACFATKSEYNGLILIKYGGTRHPTAPAGVDPFLRQRDERSPKEVRLSYEAGYAAAAAALRERFAVRFDRLVCNQISPAFIAGIPEIVGVKPDQVCVTGDRFGHVGAADTFIGLRRLRDEDRLAGRVLLAASTPYAFGAGYLDAGEPDV